MGLVFALAVAVGPASTGHSVAYGTPSPGATAPAATAGTVPAQDSASAKLAAETTAAANPAADALGSAQQPSWSAKPRVLRYLGYQLQVPSSWPVYNLATDPSKCVLFSTHAVYLGTPGSGQDCPASAVGRTEALLIQPASSASTSASAIVVGGGTAALPEAAPLPAGTTATHMFQVEIPKADVLVTATYGTNEAGLRAILASAAVTGQTASSGTSSRVSGSGSSGSGSSGSGSSGSAAPGGSAAPAASSAASQSLMTVGAPSRAAASSAQTFQLTSMVGSGLGLDTCTVPSTSTMTRWLASPYRVIGTYLGGMNWACSYGNFSASWVSHTAAQGWRFVPLWVGRQAPCSTIPGVAVINPPQAAAEGQAEAGSASASAKKFGFGNGTPIYFDMEGYNPSGSCGSAVVNFLGGWTRALHAAGYVSGVYASAASGIKNLVAAYPGSGSSWPDDIWTADWNGTPVLTDSYVPSAYWSNHQRLHQYSGPHDEKWGGATLNIDSDAADGLTVGQSSVPDSAGPAESATPSELAAAPGSTAKVTLTLHGLPETSIDVQWQADVPRGMSAAPSSGAVDLTAGGVYSATVSLAPATSLAPGRYLVPITVSSSSQTIAEAYVLAAVVGSGRSLPTHSPLVLYAADKGDMAIAAQIARGLALPASNVTGKFKQAWEDTAGNTDLVIAVGEPAANALYFNACGWTDPAGWPAGSTPFYYPGYPLRSPPGRDYFELASTPTTAGTTQLTAQLTQYTLTGTLPSYGSQLVAPTPPALSCEGSANVPVP
jgi:Domain of unknown function (DUF1906)